ncbi:MAG: DUF6364 family protein [Treponema sp.]|nr:DUF6364 family protein [Treponema sp.]
MTSTKLTLKLNSNIIALAKTYASENETSLSQLVENFFTKLTETKSNEITYSPIVQELAGIISLKDDSDYKEDYHNYLAEKYE